MIDRLKKIRKISYKINKWDDINLPSQIDFSNIASQTIQFFKKQSQLVYPAKSYFVAIVYAACMKKYFDQDFYKCLDDVELLQDDKYFVPYSKDKQTYNIIIDEIGDIWKYDSINKTVSYFKKEFLIDCDLTKDYGIDCKANRKM